MGIVELFIKYKAYYITGIKVTFLLSLFSLVIGTSLGALIGFIQMSKSKILKGISKLYIEIVRGTPMMVQITIVYFGSFLFFGVDMNGFLAALIAVSLNSAAYVAEIIRSGIQSIDRGQEEAGKSLGLTEYQNMKYIILPQAIKNILPALGNEFVTLIKETSVASTIGVADLMLAGKNVQSISYEAFTPYLVVAIIYFIMTFGLTKLIALLEGRFLKNA